VAEQNGPEISVTTSHHPLSTNPSDVSDQANDIAADAPPVEHGDSQYGDEALKLFGGFGILVYAANHMSGLGGWSEEIGSWQSQRRINTEMNTECITNFIVNIESRFPECNLQMPIQTSRQTPWTCSILHSLEPGNET
jgi:hypothetical protein